MHILYYIHIMIADVCRTEVGRNAGWEPRANTYQSRSFEHVLGYLRCNKLSSLLMLASFRRAMGCAHDILDFVVDAAMT